MSRRTLADYEQEQDELRDRAAMADLRRRDQAEIERLRSELAAARRDNNAALLEIGMLVTERDAAIRERDSRPNISHDDAAAYVYGFGPNEWRERVRQALRAHAARLADGGDNG